MGHVKHRISYFAFIPIDACYAVLHLKRERFGKYDLLPFEAALAADSTAASR